MPDHVSGGIRFVGLVIWPSIEMNSYRDRREIPVRITLF